MEYTRTCTHTRARSETAKLTIPRRPRLYTRVECATRRVHLPSISFATASTIRVHGGRTF